MRLACSGASPCQLLMRCTLHVDLNALARPMHVHTNSPIRTAAHCPLVPLLVAAQIRLANPTANGLGGRLEVLFDGQWGTVSAVLAVPIRCLLCCCMCSILAHHAVLCCLSCLRLQWCAPLLAGLLRLLLWG